MWSSQEDEALLEASQWALPQMENVAFLFGGKFTREECMIRCDQLKKPNCQDPAEKTDDDDRYKRVLQDREASFAECMIRCDQLKKPNCQDPAEKTDDRYKRVLQDREASFAGDEDREASLVKATTSKTHQEKDVTDMAFEVDADASELEGKCGGTPMKICNLELKRDNWTSFCRNNKRPTPTIRSRIQDKDTARKTATKRATKQDKTTQRDQGVQSSPLLKDLSRRELL